MVNIGIEYMKKLRQNKNQLYRDLKPKERICKIITDHIQPYLQEFGFKFVKSRMQLERVVGDFKQIVWFRTSIKNFRDEVVNFEVYLQVEHKPYLLVCDERYTYHTSCFIGTQVEYLDLWDQEFYEGWYRLQLYDNEKVAKKIADNIAKCSALYLDANSSYEQSLQYRMAAFKASDYFALLLIPDILILAHLTGNAKALSEMVETYQRWTQTEEGKKDIEEGADIFDTIEGVLKVVAKPE